MNQVRFKNSLTKISTIEKTIRRKMNSIKQFYPFKCNPILATHPSTYKNVFPEYSDSVNVSPFGMTVAFSVL